MGIYENRIATLTAAARRRQYAYAANSTSRCRWLLLPCDEPRQQVRRGLPQRWRLCSLCPLVARRLRPYGYASVSLLFDAEPLPSGLLDEGGRRHGRMDAVASDDPCAALSSTQAFPIEANDYLLRVVRYVERNPFRANPVQRAED